MLKTISTNENDAHYFPINISIRLFDEIQRRRLEQSIKIYNRTINETWHLSPASSAQVVIFSSDDPGGEFFLKFCMSKNSIIPVIYADANHSDCPWFINKKQAHSSCIETLQDVFKLLRNERKPASNEMNSPSTLLNMLQPFLSNCNKFQMNYDGNFCALLDTKHQQAFIQSSHRIDFFENHFLSLFKNINPKNFKLKQVSDSEHKKYVSKEGFTQCNYDALIWNLVQNQPHKGLMEGIEQEKFRIKRWPAFSCFQHHYGQIMIAAFLKRYASDKATIAAKTNQSISSVTQFINAAHLSNILYHESHDFFGESKTPDMKPEISSRLVRTIRTKLFPPLEK